MFNSILLLLLRVFAAVFFGGCILALLSVVFMFPSMHYNMIRWDYYQSLELGWPYSILCVVTWAIMTVMLVFGVIGALYFFTAFFLAAIGWSKPAERMMDLLDRLRRLGNSCAP